MKLQEYLIQVGDKVLYRDNVPVKEGLGFVHDKDYPGTVVSHHPEGSTRVQFIGDDGNLHEEGVEYNDFEGGMSSCKLILEPEELKRRQEAYIEKRLFEVEQEHQEKVARIRSMFDE